MVVYVDVLLILNLFVDYFLLLGCCVVMKADTKKFRLILGATVGSLFSIFIFFVEFNCFLFLFFKIISGFILVLITFGFKTKFVFIKTLVIFLLENFVFVGVMFLIWSMLSPPGMLWQNGVTYIEISPIVLITGSVVAYFLTYLFNFVFSRLVSYKKLKLIKIKFNSKVVKLKALYDTGNCLLEPFSSKPVCICEFEALNRILPEDLANFLINFSNCSFSNVNMQRVYKVKLIPCNTITGESVLPAFLPQSVTVVCNGKDVVYDCYIGVINKKISDGEYQAIIGDYGN